MVLKGLTCGDAPRVILSNSAAASLRTDALSVPGVMGRAAGDAAIPAPPAPLGLVAPPAPPGDPVFLLSKLLKKLARTPSCEVAPAPAAAGDAAGSNFFMEEGDPAPAADTCGEPRDRRSNDLGTPDAELTRAPSTRTPGPEGKAWMDPQKVAKGHYGSTSSNSSGLTTLPESSYLGKQLLLTQEKSLLVLNDDFWV